MVNTNRRSKLFSNEFGRTNDEIKTREGRFVDVSEREREFVCSHYVSGCRFDGLFFK